MANKPTSIGSLMMEKGPLQSGPGTRFTNNNRFHLLADRSDSGTRVDKGRNHSTKRSRIDSEEGEGLGVGIEVSEVFTAVEATETKIKEAKSIIEQVSKDAAGLPDSPSLMAVVGGLVKWMVATTAIQENTLSLMVDGFAGTARKAGGKKGGHDLGQGNRDQAGGGPAHAHASNHQQAKPIDERKKRFVQAVKDAEKATLVFNTDMGTVPVMNTQTMNRKFSLALKAKAAVVDGNVNGEPTRDTITRLDDTLSMVKSMDYFGKTTKKVTDNQDRDRVYYTIPVKLNYKDRETRIAAEVNLRKLCKVSCTTPYHATLRTEIKRAVDCAKVKYEATWIQARIDLEDMCLRLSYREGEVWHNDVEMIPLPEEVYDTSRKFSPRPNATTGESEKMQG